MGLLQSKGITQPPYTLPAIEDPNTGAFIIDSLAIATYLDDTYPNTPKVLTPAVRPLLEEFEHVFSLGSGGAGGGGATTLHHVLCLSSWAPIVSIPLVVPVITEHVPFAWVSRGRR